MRLRRIASMGRFHGEEGSGGEQGETKRRREVLNSGLIGREEGRVYTKEGGGVEGESCDRGI
jgi:hypothetical protein